MLKSASFLCAAAVLAVSLASAADVTGKWTAKVPRRDETVDTTFTLKAEGATLTGTVTTDRGDRPIANGKVDGDKITFTVEAGQGGSQTYKGAVAGNEIKFSREGGRGGPREFVAKRAD